ncbi:MAG: iron ABC transporter substrate-binding protein [Deltaproteobacteria bacterium]|nr:ABC transporter substrate-binding protein [Deltaproteobacteria bacterium]RLA91144.1 MAG: iron ABC transporter substrate-binding protein [Deltaproteobacteria bacterium]
MKRFFIIFIALILTLSIGIVPAFAKKKLVVYTSLETDEAIEYMKIAKKDLPDIDIKWIRLSTGELGARMLAERNNPQADCIWGWAVTNMEQFIPKGLLVPYKPKGLERIPARFKDPKGYWVAIDLYAAAFVINTKELAKRKLPMPHSWADLTKPVYKGLVIMPNPASSGTGYLQVSSILQMFGAKEGKEDGWEFLKKLDKNIGQYIKSGSKPAKLTAAGEYVIGCSFAFVYSQLKKRGFPVALQFPAEGAGYELEANALLKGAKHPKEAKRFLDWAISDNAMRAYSKFKLGVTLPGIPGPKDLPPLSSIKLYPMDFKWSAAHRDQILEKWQKLFLK